MDGQEDNFCLGYIILMYRNNTGMFHITQTDIAFSITKDSLLQSANFGSEQIQSRLVAPGDEYLVAPREIIFPGVVLLIQGQDKSNFIRFLSTFCT